MFWRKKDPPIEAWSHIKSHEQWEREFGEVFAVRVRRAVSSIGVGYVVELLAPSLAYGVNRPEWHIRCSGIATYEAAVKAADLLFKTKGEPETVYEIGPQYRGARP
jgi:hypothetical protein